MKCLTANEGNLHGCDKMQAVCQSQHIGMFRENRTIGIEPPRGWNHGARQGLQRKTAMPQQQELQITLNCRAGMMFRD